MRVAVIGAGLGGLLSAVALASQGNEVVVYEKLGFPGGRFTNFTYKGFQLSTGALHMIPHANRGPLANLLRKFNIKIKIHESYPQALFRIGGKNYSYNKVIKLFPLLKRIKLYFILSYFKYGKGNHEILYEWIERKIGDPLAIKITDSFCGFSLSVTSKQINVQEFVSITKNIYKLGGPGIPDGGCKGITDALVNKLFEYGGKLKLKNEVKRIIVNDNKAKKVVVNDSEESFDIIISNIGPKQTLELIGKENLPEDYVRDINKIKEACGIKISVGCDKPMLGFSGILFTPEAERIAGINEVTNAVPDLAPHGKHLVMSHQPLLPKRNIKREIKLGIEDLRNIFSDFDDHCKILAIQIFKDSLPVNRSVSGISFKTPISNLFLVGDAVKPRGYMETEGIAAGVKEMIEYINRKHRIY